MDRFSTVDRILSVSAIVSAIAAVAIGLYQARITREYQEISVWPYVHQYNSDQTGSYRRWVENRGVGPAVVKSFEVFVDGERQPGWAETIGALTGASRIEYVYGSIGEGTVLLPGEPYRILEMPLEPLGALFDREVDRMETRICYCSLYDECWLAGEDGPEPIASCPADADVFE